MEELFVPSELAIKAKEKGFTDPCFGFHKAINASKHELKLNNYFAYNIPFMFDHNTNTQCPGDCSAPIYQQLVDWLEAKHGFFFERLMNDNKQIYCVLWNGAAGYVELQTLDKAIEQAFKLI